MKGTKFYAVYFPEEISDWGDKYFSNLKKAQKYVESMINDTCEALDATYEGVPSWRITLRYDFRSNFNKQDTYHIFIELCHIE